jgi:DNA-binding GntR family transcriptional regulator
MSELDALPEITAVPRGALRHEVMKRLLRAIFEGKLPAGTRLMVMKLASRFGTSSTPVREALVELDAVGVVEFVHNRGAVVAPFGPEELRQIYHIRRVLETEATRCACGRVDPQALAALKRQIDGLIDDSDALSWLQQAVATDRQLHELIGANCGNPRLAREIRRYDTLVQTIREIIGNDRTAQGQAMREHVDIVERLLGDDAAAAAAAMEHHILSAAQLAESVMFSRR